MSDESKPRVRAIFLGATIPLEAFGPAGQFLALLHEHHAAGFEFEPVYDPPLEPSSLAQAREVPALPPPRQAQIAKRVAAIVEADRPVRPRRRADLETFKSFLEKLISRRPITRARLKAAVAKRDTWDLRSLEARLHELRKDRRVVLIDGTYHARGGSSGTKPTKRRQKVAPRKKPVTRKTDGPTQESLLLALLMRADPNPVAAAQMQALFARKKLRAKSAGTAIHTLVRKGLAVKGPERGTYIYKHPTPEEPSHAVSAPA